MLNELLQWSAIAIMALFLLGALRQIGLMLPARTAPSQGGPPEGRKLPKRAYEGLTGVFGGEVPAAFTVAFVSESCAGCQRLLSRQAESPTKGSLTIVARDPSAGFSEAIEELDVRWIADVQGEIWDACGVTATPLVLEIERGGRVARKEVTADVSEFVSSSTNN